MRIGTTNMLGLKGYPPEEAIKELGGPDSEKTAVHFQKVFEELSCDILALEEGVPIRQIQRIALSMGINVATFPSPMHWPGHQRSSRRYWNSGCLSQRIRYSLR